MGWRRTGRKCLCSKKRKRTWKHSRVQIGNEDIALPQVWQRRPSLKRAMSLNPYLSRKNLEFSTLSKNKLFCLNYHVPMQFGKWSVQGLRDELVIQGSHMVSGTQCPAGSDPVKKWSETVRAGQLSTAAQKAKRCPIDAPSLDTFHKFMKRWRN